MKELSKSEIYQRVMKYIDTTSDIETLKSILIDTLDNAREESSQLLCDAYYHYIEEGNY